MAKYIDADRLKEEFQKRFDICKRVSDDARNALDTQDWYRGKYTAYSECLSFIDSLQREQPIQVNAITWRDINDLERIINNVHYEFRNGIGEKSFGEEVLERFRAERDEQEKQDVDLEKEINRYFEPIYAADIQFEPFTQMAKCARHFYELGQKDAANKFDEIEYNRQRAEEKSK